MHNDSYFEKGNERLWIMEWRGQVRGGLSFYIKTVSEENRRKKWRNKSGEKKWRKKVAKNVSKKTKENKIVKNW